MLAVVSTARAGSSLLGRLISETEGVGYPGEIDLLWGRTIAKGEDCGCGRRPMDCPVWSKVIARFGADTHRTSDEVRELAAELDQTRSNFGLEDAIRLPPRLAPELQRFVTETMRLTEAYLEVTGTTTVVDTSKSLIMAALLPHFSAFDTGGVFLHRRPAAVYASNHRRSRDPNPWVLGPRVAMGWGRVALTATALRRRGVEMVELDYHRVTTDPSAAVATALSVIEHRNPARLRSTKAGVAFSEAHVATGNQPNQEMQGPTKIEPDYRPSDPSDRIGPLLADVLTIPFGPQRRRLISRLSPSAN